GLLPHGAIIKEVSSEGVFLMDGNNEKISVTEMSDGFRSILSMTFEIIRHIVQNFGADTVFQSVKKNINKVAIQGVVLIDEIDAHLHPTWQTRIGEWFTKYFPNIQFIVTTHSPLVCRACKKGSIWRLAAPGREGEEGEIIGIEKEKLINGNILDAYGTELFGQSPVRSLQSNAKKARLGKLNVLFALDKISAEEKEERRELQKILTTDDPTGF
ncbi:MAG: AAA family ATPase, partial [Chitinophagales bacterium]